MRLSLQIYSKLQMEEKLCMMLPDSFANPRSVPFITKYESNYCTEINPVHLTSIVLGMRGLPLELGNLSNTLMAYRNGLIPGIDILFCQIQGKIC